MKIRTKIVVMSIAVVVFAVLACTVLLLVFVRNSTIEALKTTAVSDTENFVKFFSDNAEEAESDQVLQRSYGLYRFRQMFLHEEFTLLDGDEYISNRFGFSPESVTEFDAKTPYTEQSAGCFFTERDGVRYAIVTRMAQLNRHAYVVSLVRDVTETFDRLNRLQWICITVCLAVTLLCTVFMRVIVVRALRPIETLRKNASDIAAGQYRNRINVGGRDELSALAMDFNTMADAIERHIEALDEKNARQQMFINDLSHELKTPVTSILLNAETLLNRSVPSEEREHVLLRIYDQGRWLERLSQKLMTLVLLNGGIERKPYPVSELIEAVKGTTENSMKEQGMQLITACDDGVLWTDPDLLRSAVVNLVENAKKASERGQTIELTARAGIITVRDYGRGIVQSEIERITEPFYRIDRSRSRKKGGAGLGLALVKRIAEAHHATLVIESEPQKGTAVSLRF